jgi:hypothetical protein
MHGTRNPRDDHADAYIRCAAGHAVSGKIAVAVEDDLEGGKRADGAEKGRETPVNNGHSRSTTDTRKPALTRGATL